MIAIEVLKRQFVWISLGFLALLAGFFLFPLTRSVSGQQFEDFFEPYPIPTNSTVQSNQLNWLAGVAQYRQEQYGSSIAFFRAARREGGLPPWMIEFYLAQAWMATGRSDSAVGCLEEVLQQQSGIQSLARWYLGLAHWEVGSEEKARYHFQILNEEGGYRSHDAGTILQSF